MTLETLSPNPPAMTVEELGLWAEAALREERERCENSLIEFVRCSWPHLGESGEFMANWHHEAIAGEVEAITFGRSRYRSVVANQPPRTTKSSLLTICYPAWCWAQPEGRWWALSGPQVRFFCLSYGATLAEELAVKSRRLIMGDWYQRHWGHQVKIRDDQGSRANFANFKGGERISTSIEGGLLGRGGLVQICDDPHSLKGAESDTQRKETLEGMRSLTTRITDPRYAVRFLVMQRLRQDDATNYALENWPKVRHIMFPMRFDSRRADPADPRTEDGELLWPQVWNEESVQQEEDELQAYGVAGQLQQAPIARGGGIIKRDWWKLWPDDYPQASGLSATYLCSTCGWNVSMRDEFAPTIECGRCGSDAARNVNYPESSFRLMSVDTSYGEKKENSFSAATIWQIWHNAEGAPNALLRLAWRGRPRLLGIPGATNPWERTGLVERIYDLATKQQVDVVLIENKSRGTDLYQELEKQVQEWPFQLQYYEPVHDGAKMVRLEATVPLFAKGMVWAPDKAWAETVISEVEAQPGAEYDDLTDCVSSGLLFLRQHHYLSLPAEHTREERQKLIFRGRSSRGIDIREMYEGS